MRYESILEAIGNTPIVRLNKLTGGMKCRVYAKLKEGNYGLAFASGMAAHGLPAGSAAPARLHPKPRARMQREMRQAGLARAESRALRKRCPCAASTA